MRRCRPRFGLASVPARRRVRRGLFFLGARDIGLLLPGAASLSDSLFGLPIRHDVIAQRDAASRPKRTHRHGQLRHRSGALRQQTEAGQHREDHRRSRFPESVGEHPDDLLAEIPRVEIEGLVDKLVGDVPDAVIGRLEREEGDRGDPQLAAAGGRRNDGRVGEQGHQHQRQEPVDPLRFQVLPQQRQDEELREAADAVHARVELSRKGGTFSVHRDGQLQLPDEANVEDRRKGLKGDDLTEKPRQCRTGPEHPTGFGQQGFLSIGCLIEALLLAVLFRLPFLQLPRRIETVLRRELVGPVRAEHR
mmetsp:Transcript_25837/g.60576  ORF Transcript_25837/g.60576 Transcript_25837/m.60576 type:complete len:306 (+) Transcript_25837:595-1512(+)